MKTRITIDNHNKNEVEMSVLYTEKIVSCSVDWKTAIFREGNHHQHKAIMFGWIVNMFRERR